jgi:hypothetical protein
VPHTSYMTYADYRQVASADITSKPELYEHKARAMSFWEQAQIGIDGDIRFEISQTVNRLINAEHDFLSIFVTDQKSYEELYPTEEYIYTLAEEETERANRWLQIQLEIKELQQRLGDPSLTDSDRAIVERQLDRAKKESAMLEKAMTTAGEQAYMAYQKARESEELLDKAYYLANATAWNHFGGYLQCVVTKLVETFMPENGDLETDKIDNAISVLQATRALIAFFYSGLAIDTQTLMDKLKSLVAPWATLPQRIAMNVLTKARQFINIPLFSVIEDVTGKVQSETCIPLNVIAEMLIDYILEVENKVEEQVLSVLQFNESYFKATNDYLVILEKKQKAKELHKVLGLFVEILQMVKDYGTTPRDRMIADITKLLAARGYDSYYDPDLDRIFKSTRVTSEGESLGNGKEANYL